MRNKRNLKKMNICFAAILAISLCCSGCQKKANEDSFVIDELEESEGDVQKDGLANELGVPVSVNREITVEAGTLTSVYFSDDSVSVPDTSAMYEVYCKKMPLDAAYRQKVSDYVFGDDAVRYVYDDRLTKEECEAYIDYYEKQEQGPYGGSGIYSLMADEYRTMLESAPDSREKAVDFSGDQYIGEIDGQTYLLSFHGNAGSCISVELSLFPKISAAEFYGIDEAYGEYGAAVDSFLVNGSLSDDLKEGADTFARAETDNICGQSADEAASEMIGYVEAITDLPMTEVLCKAADFNYAVESIDDMVYLKDGYNISYLTKINGVLPYITNLYNLDGEEEASEDWCAAVGLDQTENAAYPSEALTSGTVVRIATSSHGLLGFGCLFPVNDVSDYKKVTLLSWTSLFSELETELSAYYAQKNISYSSIRFNEAELSYYPKETDDGYVYRPAWIFSTVQDDVTVRLLVVDAADGTILY